MCLNKNGNTDSRPRPAPASPHSSLCLQPLGSTASVSHRWMETFERQDAWCLAASPGPGIWEDTRAHAGLLQSWPKAPVHSRVCPALSITSYKDKQCPLSQKSWPIGLGPARAPHFCRKPKRCSGPTELMGTARAGAPQDAAGQSGALQLEARRLGSLGMAQPALLKPLVSL